jgi:hypothetical protein
MAEEGGVDERAIKGVRGAQSDGSACN